MTTDTTKAALADLFKDAIDWARSYGSRLSLSDITVTDVTASYADKAVALLRANAAVVPDGWQAERKRCAELCRDIYSWRGAYMAGKLCSNTTEACAKAIEAQAAPSAPVLAEPKAAADVMAKARELFGHVAGLGGFEDAVTELLVYVQGSNAPLVSQQPVQGGGDALSRERDLYEALQVARDHIDMHSLEISHCKDHARINAALALPPARPAPEFDVRTILLDVVPGDGEGLEVYAKTTADVVARLTELDEKLERPELAQPAPQAQGVTWTDDDALAALLSTGDGPFGNDAVTEMREFLQSMEVARANKLDAPPSPVAQPEALPVQGDDDEATIADYQEALRSVDALVREMDVALNGEAGAAPQARLCDLVHQVKEFAGRASLPTSGAPWDLICQAIKKADDITMEGDYMLDSKECIQVVRTMQVLVEIAAPQPAAARVGLSAEHIHQIFYPSGSASAAQLQIALGCARAIESAHGIASPQEDGGTA